MTEWGIDTLFNPGKRHMDEEKRRLQSTREEIGDSSGGRRIDLESGTVRISRKPNAPVAENNAAEDDTAQAEAAGDEAAEVEAAKDEVESVTAAESVDQAARTGSGSIDEESSNSQG